MKKFLLTTGILLSACAFVTPAKAIELSGSTMQNVGNIRNPIHINTLQPSLPDFGGANMSSGINPGTVKVMLIDSNGNLHTKDASINAATDIMNVNKLEKEYRQNIYTNTLQKEKRGFLSEQNPENNITDLRTKKSKKTKITVKEDI